MGKNFLNQRYTEKENFMLKEIIDVLGYGSEITNTNIAELKKKISPNFDLLDLVKKMDQGKEPVTKEDRRRTVENQDIEEVEKLFVQIRESFNRYIIIFQRSRNLTARLQVLLEKL